MAQAIAHVHHLDGRAVLTSEGASAEHVHVVHRKRAGHEREDAGPVPRDDRDAVDVADAVVAERSPAPRALDELQVRSDDIGRRAEEVGRRELVEVCAHRRKLELAGEGSQDGLPQECGTGCVLGDALCEPAEHTQVQRAHERRLPGTPDVGTARPCVGDRDHVEQVQRVCVTHELGHLADHALVGDVAAGGDRGEQQVLLRGHHEAARRVGIEAGARGEPLNDDAADATVVALVPFADVVQQRRQEQLILARQLLRGNGRGRLLGILGDRAARFDDRAPSVHVDGVAVEWRDVRQPAEHFPLGQNALQPRRRWHRLETGCLAAQRHEQQLKVTAFDRGGYRLHVECLTRWCCAIPAEEASEQTLRRWRHGVEGALCLGIDGAHREEQPPPDIHPVESQQLRDWEREVLTVMVVRPLVQGMQRVPDSQ